jgi:hypothetical protein
MTTLRRKVMRHQFVTRILKCFKETFVLSPSWLHYVAIVHRNERDITYARAVKVNHLGIRTIWRASDIVALILLHCMSASAIKKTLVSYHAEVTRTTFSKLDARVPTEVMNGRHSIHVSRFISALYTGSVLCYTGFCRGVDCARINKWCESILTTPCSE